MQIDYNKAVGQVTDQENYRRGGIKEMYQNHSENHTRAPVVC